MPPQQTTRSIGDAVFPNTFDDRAGAEGGSLDQRTIDLRAGRVQCLSDEQSGQPRIDEHGAVAVVPVERDETRFAGLRARRLPGELGVKRLAAAGTRPRPTT